MVLGRIVPTHQAQELRECDLPRGGKGSIPTGICSMEERHQLVTIQFCKVAGRFYEKTTASVQMITALNPYPRCRRAPYLVVGINTAMENQKC
jgi:hypothetical protein